MQVDPIKPVHPNGRCWLSMKDAAGWGMLAGMAMCEDRKLSLSW